MTTGLPITRRACLSLGAAAAACSFVRPAAAASRIDVVAELFSSQGCSSCPPADAVLNEIRTSPGALAISYHVDYWDYLGWKDTLASPEFSQRQYDYAKARGDMDVYTPQMIINGGKPLVGSQRSEVYAVLEQSRKPSWPVPITLGDAEKEIIVDLGASDVTAGATLWVMAVRGSETVKIARGELAGHDFTYHNVVAEIVPAGMYSGKTAVIRLPKDGVLSADSTACVALLQEGKVGPVLGAAMWGTLVS
jgi:hypothetical protein